MVLSDADTLMKLNPFWTILLSLIFLNEKVRKYQIIAMIVAILGMLFIVKPEFSSTMITSLAGLFSGIFFCIHMCSCIKYQRSTIYYCFYFSLFSVVVLIPFSIATYEPMTTIQMVYLLGAGLFSQLAKLV